MSRILLVGLGSPHGDDQIGWKVVEQMDNVPGDVEARVLREPTALWDHLGRCQRLVVIDACQSDACPGTPHRLTWPLDLHPVPLRSSHGFDLASVLRLAESIGRLPSEVVLLAIEMDGCQAGDDLSPALRQALPHLVEVVRQELRR